MIPKTGYQHAAAVGATPILNLYADAARLHGYTQSRSPWRRPRSRSTSIPTRHRVTFNFRANGPYNAIGAFAVLGTYKQRIHQQQRDLTMAISGNKAQATHGAATSTSKLVRGHYKLPQGVAIESASTCCRSGKMVTSTFLVGEGLLAPWAVPTAPNCKLQQDLATGTNKRSGPA